jgi:tetratricopeptide (TPR) repeat protein
MDRLLGNDEDITLMVFDSGDAPKIRSDAVNLGRQVNANLVVWGNVVEAADEHEVYPRMTTVHPPRGVKDKGDDERMATIGDAEPIRIRMGQVEDAANLALFAIARSYKATDPEKALVLIDKLPADNPDRFMLQGGILSELDRDEEALAAYEMAASLAPESPRPHIQIGWLLFFGDAEFTECEVAFSEARRVAPDMASVYLELATFYSYTGQTKAAITEIEKCRPLAGTDADTYAGIGSAYNMAGRYESAIDAYKTAITLAPGDIDARCGLAIVYSHMGKYDAAADELVHATKLAPDEASPWQSLGWTRIAQGKFEDAVTCFEQAASLDTADATNYAGMGRAYAELGDRAEAARAFERASSGPLYELGLTRLAAGVNYRSVGWYDDALTEFQAAAEDFPDDFTVHYFKGMVLEDMGEFERALSSYRDALDCDPEAWWYWPQIRYFLALVRLGRHVEADAYLNEYHLELQQTERLPDIGLLPVVELYSGEIGERQYMNAMLADQPSYGEDGKCVADYYLGMANLLPVLAFAASADTVRAIELFEECVATMSDDLVEYHSAKSELARLK